MLELVTAISVNASAPSGFTPRHNICFNNSPASATMHTAASTTTARNPPARNSNANTTSDSHSQANHGCPARENENRSTAGAARCAKIHSPVRMCHPVSPSARNPCQPEDSTTNSATRKQSASDGANHRLHAHAARRSPTATPAITEADTPPFYRPRPPAPIGPPRPLFHILPEPGHRPRHHVPHILRLVKPVPLARIHHQPRLHPQTLQRVPVFKRLWRRTLPVAIAHHHQRRRLHVLHKIDRRALGIHRRIVVNRRPKIRNHPLIDGILPIVALPVRQPRPRHRRAPPLRLRHRPHRHVSAIAPPGDPHPLAVHRILRRHRIHPRQNVLQIPAAEVLHIRRRERLPLPIAPPRIREEHEIPFVRQQRQIEKRSRPRRLPRARRPPMHTHYHRIFLRPRLVPGRQHQPSLHLEFPALPSHALRLAPGRLHPRVGVAHLLPPSHRTRPNLRRHRPRRSNRRRRPVFRQRNLLPARVYALIALPVPLRRPARQIQRRYRRRTSHRLGKKNPLRRRQPTQPARRRLPPRRPVHRLAPRRRHRIDVPARRPLVAHDPLDERDRRSIRRPLRPRHLHLRIMHRLHRPARHIQRVHLRRPPIVVPRPRRRRIDKMPAIRRPVVFIDVQPVRRHRTHLPRPRVDHHQPLQKNRVVDHSRRRCLRLQRPRRPRRVLGKQHRDPPPVRSPLRPRQKTLQTRQPVRFERPFPAHRHRPKLQLPRIRAPRFRRQKRHPRAIRRPRRLPRSRQSNRSLPPLPQRSNQHPRRLRIPFRRLCPCHHPPVRRNRRLAQRLHLVQVL